MGFCPIHGLEVEKDLSIVKSYIITSGVAQWLACWAHNPKVRGSKPRSAILIPTSHGSMQIVHDHEHDPHDVGCSTSFLMGMKPKAFWVQFQFLSLPTQGGENTNSSISLSPPPACPPAPAHPPPSTSTLTLTLLLFNRAAPASHIAFLSPRCNSLSSHSQLPAGNKHDQDMTSRNRQPNLVGTLPVSTFLFRGLFKPPFRLEACLFIVFWRWLDCQMHRKWNKPDDGTIESCSKCNGAPHTLNDLLPFCFLCIQCV